MTNEKIHKPNIAFEKELINVVLHLLKHLRSWYLASAKFDSQNRGIVMSFFLLYIYFIIHKTTEV